MSAEKKSGQKKGAGDSVHVLSGDLTLQSAAGVKAELEKAVASGRNVVLRFDAVDAVDLSFIQLLCSAHRSVHDRGHTLELEGEKPEAFTRLIKESGLDVHVGCWFDDSVECPWIVNQN